MWPKNNTSPLAINATLTTLKWVSKVDFIFGNEEFYFLTHNPTSFKLGPGIRVEVEKMRPKSYPSQLAIKTTSTTFKWVCKVDFIFGNREFSFSTHNPTSFKLGPEMLPEVEKMLPKS
jgi:hypothetical protein